MRKKVRTSAEFQVSDPPSLSNNSTRAEIEMDNMSDGGAGMTDDEETGLSEGVRKGRRLRKQRNTLLGDQAPDDEEGQKKLGKKGLGADMAVVKKSLVNVGLIGLWYLFSLSISLYNKWMFGPDHLNFHFPLFSTSMHFLVQFTLASTLLYFIPRLRPSAEFPPKHHSHIAGGAAAARTDGGLSSSSKKKPVMTRYFYLTRIAPCGAATGLDIGLGNMSLRFITLTFFTMCKSSSLAFVLLFAFIFRLESPSIKLVLIIATMTAGVVLMVFGETAFSALGFTLIISSSFFSGFRWALTQILLIRNPATSNPFAGIFFLAPIMFLTLVALAIPIEGFADLGAGLATLSEKEGTFKGLLLLLFPGVLAFCMTSAEFALLQRTSVVTLSICGIFKEVVTISAAELVYHDKLTPINLSGLVVTILSIAAYNWIKIQKMRADARGSTKGEAAYVKIGAKGVDGEEEDDEESEVLASDPLAAADVNEAFFPRKKANATAGTSNSTSTRTRPSIEAEADDEFIIADEDEELTRHANEDGEEREAMLVAEPRR